MAIIRAAQAGNFSDTSTWVGGVVPTTGDIACPGNFRVTVDQNVLATLSPTNIDWVASGGTALATTHTGGFNIPPNSNYSVAAIRYECFKTNADLTDTADIYCLNASLTVGDMECIGASALTSNNAMYVTTTNANPIVITVNRIICPSTTATGHYAIKLNGTANLSNMTLNVNGNIETTNSATVSVGKAIRVTGTFANLYVNILGSIIAGAIINITPTTIPTGQSIVNFNTKVLIVGSGNATNTVIVSSVKNINFNSGICQNTAISGSSINVAANEILVNGNIEQLLNSTSLYVFTSSLSTTVNGDIIRNPSIATATQSLCSFTGTGNVTVNGVLKELADNQTSGSSTYYVVTLANLTANFYCKGILATGKPDYVIDTTTSIWNYSLTIDGDIVATNASYQSSANALVRITCPGITLIITGSIYPCNQGTTNSYSSGCVNITATPKVVRVLGTCFGSTKQPAISLSPVVNQPTQEFFINKVVGADYSSADTYQIATLYAEKAVVTINELVVGSSGRNPINGHYLFKDTTTAVIKARNSLGAEILLMQQTANSIPSVNDIREGVSIGGSVGTLVIPSEEDVKSGIVYGNDLVGELNLCPSPEGNTSLGWVTVANAVADGFWTDPSIWDTQVVPNAGTFVYTRGKTITLNSLAECAALADTELSSGLILDQPTNTNLLAAFGDPLFSDVKVLMPLETNLTNYGSATVTSTESSSESYAAAPVSKFNTNTFRVGQNVGLLWDMPQIDNTKALTVEWWWYPTALNSSYTGLIPTVGNLELFTGNTHYSLNGNRTYIASSPIKLNQWNHIAIQRTKTGQFQIYVDGLLIASGNMPVIAAGQWRWFTAQQSYGAYLKGYLAQLRVTLGNELRYSSNFTVPNNKFVTYAPAPNSVWSGRIILGEQGALSLKVTTPTSNSAGVAQDLQNKVNSYFKEVLNQLNQVKQLTTLFLHSD